MLFGLLIKMMPTEESQKYAGIVPVGKYLLFLKLCRNVIQTVI